MPGDPAPSGEISGQSCPALQVAFTCRCPPPHQHLSYCGRFPSSPLLHPARLPKTTPSPTCPPLPPASCKPFSRPAFPSARLAPHPPVLPAPIFPGGASPPAAATTRSGAKAARTRAARAMAGGDQGSTLGLGARSPPRPGAPLTVPPASLSLAEQTSLFSSRPSLATSLYERALSLAASPSRLPDAGSSLAGSFCPAQVCALSGPQHQDHVPAAGSWIEGEELKSNVGGELLAL